MNIHEFQAKQLFAQFGIPVPKGKEIKKMFTYYTMCPKCAAHYGKNYVVILAQV